MEQEKNKNKFLIIGILLVIISVVLCILFMTKTIGYNKNTKGSIKEDNNQNVDNPKESNNPEEYIIEDEEKINNCEKNYAMMYNANYIYKAKINSENGANVYDSYNESNQNVIDTIEKGKIIGIIADVIDTQKYYNDTKKNSIDSFKDIHKYYYFAIYTCGEPKYVKYSDVLPINSTIEPAKEFDEIKQFYITDNDYLYSGPGLSFEQYNDTVKISKGTIINTNKYISIGNAIWLYINNEKYHGWILKKYSNSVNYPYNNIKYGNAIELVKTSGEITLTEEKDLYKYAHISGNEEIISIIPANTTITYDSSIRELGIIHYHINYNGTEGWISQLS